MYAKNKAHNSIDVKSSKELFQYSVGKKMDNAKKIVFCAFLLHFFHRGQLQSDGKHNMSRKGARIKGKIVNCKTKNL